MTFPTARIALLLAEFEHNHRMVICEVIPLQVQQRKKGQRFPAVQLSTEKP